MSKKRQRLILVGVFALFFIPVLTAWIMRHNPLLVGTVNKGVLLDPPRAISAQTLKIQRTPYPDAPLLSDSWSVITLTGNVCDDRCSESLYATRQARAGVNQNYDRVRRILVVTEALPEAPLASLTKQHPDLVVVIAPRVWLANFKGEMTPVPDTFVVDPRGFLFITYPQPTQPADLLKDLKRLLRISAVG